MIVYVVERLVDGPSERAEEVAREFFVNAEIMHGAVAIGEGRFGSIEAWKKGWPPLVKKLARDLGVIVTARRTLALAGTVEVEDAMALGLPVWTVHGLKLQEISHLWYVEDACRYRCIGKGHRQRMHGDPNRVAETRVGYSPLVADGREPESTYKPRFERASYADREKIRKR